MNKKILVTGSAGFIGFHLVEKLLRDSDWNVIGIDNINNYYDVNLKYARLAEAGIIKKRIMYNKVVVSEKYNKYNFIKLNLEDKENILRLFEEEKFDYVVNLAAQAGVRYSLENPQVYINSNINGFLNILEGCRHFMPKHLIYASSSSVYGNNLKMPLSTSDNVDHPLSLYAATKKSNELMSHTYSHLFGLPTSGLRFFTAYGPWGRPDMALFIFTKNILDGSAINVFNNGDMLRDFTYIEDVVTCIQRIIEVIPVKSDKENNDPSISYTAPYKIYNIGNSDPINLLDFINAIEEALGKKAVINYLPMQPGDVKKTFSDINNLYETIHFKPCTKIEKGIDNFIKWYTDIYQKKII